MSPALRQQPGPLDDPDERIDVTNPKPLHTRLAAKLSHGPDGCWRWTGATTNGYGTIGVGGRGTGNMPTHVASYVIHRGSVPQGLVLDHLCRNRACCNPWHLEAVTNCVNSRRGRATKLSAGEVEAIRELWTTTSMSQAEIARRFEVHPSHVSRIISHARWGTTERLITHRIHGAAA